MPITGISDDELAVIALTQRFADALTRVDSVAFAALWDTPGEWLMGPPANFRVHGTADHITAAMRERRARWEFFIQIAHSTVPVIDGDVATSRSYITERGQLVSGAGYHNHGLYVSDLIRTSNGWAFRRRRYHYLYLDTTSLTGTGFPPPNLD